jgi:hypothetical protein
LPPQLAPPLPLACPWGGFTPPNVDWCEENLCAWIVNPAGTWSNLAYFAFGAWMLAHARRRGRPELARFGYCSFAVGAASFAYHASYTFALQFWDFAGMFLFCFLVIATNAERLGWIARGRVTRAWLIGTAAFSALVPLVFQTGFPIQSLVALSIALSIAQEARLFASTRKAARAGSSGYASYALALALLGSAALFSALDVTRIWCDPGNLWMQGHAWWHLLSAAALAALLHFYVERAALER